MTAFDIVAIQAAFPSQPIEHYPVAVSVEALGLEWSRRRGAEVGSVVFVDSEVSPKVRRGLPAVGHGPAFAVIVSQDDPEAISTLRGSLALAQALHSLTGDTTECFWPRSVVCDGETVGVVSIELLPLTFGRAVMAFRFAVAGASPTDVALAVIRQLVDPVDDVIAAYSGFCATLNNQVTAKLTPRGEVTAQAVGISDIGALQLEMASGRIADLPIEQALSVELAGKSNQ